MTIPVDGVNTDFSMCVLGDELWVAVGRAPETDLTVEGRGVPVSSVGLERLDSRVPLLPFPDLNEHTQRIHESLDDRFGRVPFSRVRSDSDYWALWTVENDHVKRLARREDLSDSETEDLAAYWRRRIEAALNPTVERLRFRGMRQHPSVSHRSAPGPRSRLPDLA